MTDNERRDWMKSNAKVAFLLGFFPPLAGLLFIITLGDWYPAAKLSIATIILWSLSYLFYRHPKWLDWWFPDPDEDKNKHT